MSFEKAIDILYKARKNGIGILLNERQLQLKVPKHTSIDPGLLEEIRKYKESLVEYLDILAGQSLEVSREGINFIPSADRPLHIPLSYSQERLWFIDRLQGSVQYHQPTVLRLKGRIDIDMLGKTIQTIVNRHEVLRTVICQEEGQPYQQILDGGNWQLTLIEGRAFMDDQDALRKEINDLISRPFDLSKDYMIRAQLIQLLAEEHVLVMTMHHIASDGWSRPILVRELITLYHAFVTNSLIPLPALTVQYADYAIWQRQYLQGEVLTRKLAYWQRQLADIPSLQLPTDFPRPLVQQLNGAHVQLVIDYELTGQLRVLAHQQGVTLYMTLLAVFNILLSRHSGQRDVCIGSGIANRQQPEIAGLIGFFVNMLVLRSTIPHKQPFLVFLQQVKETTLAAYEHQDVPFEKIVEVVARERNMTWNPLFQVSFVLQNNEEVAVQEDAIDGLRLEAEAFDYMTSKFDITYSVQERQGRLEVHIEYNTDLYTEATITRMFDHYHQLLKAVVINPAAAIDSLPMLTRTEEQQLINGFNNTFVDYPAGETIVSLLEEQGHKDPDHTALVFGPSRLTYRELHERSNQLSHYLRQHGIGEESLVPVCMERGTEMVVALLAVLKAGGAYVPVDPEYPQERIRYMLDDSARDIVISSKACRHKLAGVKPGIRIITPDGEEEAVIREAPKEPVITSLTRNNLCYVIYTSGSTGRPKGVMVEHRGLTNLIHWHLDVYSVTDASRATCVAGMGFDAFGWELWPYLSAGATVYILGDDQRMSATALQQFVTDEGVTHLFLTPALVGEFTGLSKNNCPSLQYLLTGGDQLGSIEVGALHYQVVNNYGPTENSVVSSYYPLQAGQYRGLPPIGRPLSNQSIYILDKDNRLLPVGIPGELCVAGIGLARGYLNRPDLTAEKFVANPFRNGEKMYRTGDLARWLADGNIEFLGRIDDQVKIRGYRVEPGEAENALNSLEAVHNSCVVAKQDRHGMQWLAGYFVPERTVVQKKEQELYAAQIAGWKDLYETTYSKENINTQVEAEFDIVGWNNSFTGEAIPAEEMREWVEDIVKVILAGKPRRVLEIGCGTGLVYYGISDHIERYTGTDFSQASINKIRTRIGAGTRNYPATTLHVAAAHEVILEAGERVDTIVLNSIVQYFPGEEYLTQVLLNSLSLLEEGGRLIIGDVRDYRSLKSFKTRLLLPRLGDQCSLDELEWNIDQEVCREEELCLSPDYFYYLQSRCPQIRQVDIQWKQASYTNELSLYRYTVVLQVGRSGKLVEPEWQPWQDVSVQQVRQQFEEGQPWIGCRDVPNPRVWQERLLAKGLKEKTMATAGALAAFAAVKDPVQVSVEDLLHQARQFGYIPRFYVASDVFTTHILFTREPANELVQLPEPGPVDIAGYANIPLFQEICSVLQNEIRGQLQQWLPEYLIPARLIALPYLPVTANGKVDRKLLTTLEDAQPTSGRSYMAPHTHTEQVITRIWQQLLGVDKISIHDNFFELGGHSLLATKVVSAIRRELQTEVVIRDLFSYPTVAQLALHLDNTTGTTALLPAIGAIERPARIPLSFSQERLWFIDRMQGSIQYHVPVVLQLTGKLDISRLEQAFRAVIQRHEVLRTVLKEENGQPYQFIRDDSGWRMDVMDGAMYKGNEAALTVRIASLITQPFDLSSDYLLRVHLLQLAAEEYILIIIQHHIAADGWSSPILVKELVSLYKMGIAGEEPLLPPLPIQYADYALWQRRYLEGSVLEQQLDYWKNKLKDITALQLPTDKVRPAIQSSRGKKLHFFVEEPLKSSLQALSNSQGTTLFMTLASVLKVLLYRYSGQQDIAIGSPIANRRQQETDGLIGFFVNTLVLRSTVEPHTSFADFLQQVKENTLSAYEHQDTPFEKLVELLLSERDVSRSPLFQVLFVLQNNEEVELAVDALGEVKLEIVPYKHATAKFDLNVSLREHNGGLLVGLEYCTDLFEETTIENLFVHFRQLMIAVVSNPEARIFELPMLTHAEEIQLLKTFNNTDACYPDGTITDLFAQQVQRTPDQVAVVYEDRQLSYRELDERSNQLAHFLQKQGVTADSPVPVCMERSPEMVIAILAILKAGGAYVPVDPTYPEERITYMLRDIGSNWMISSTLCRHCIDTTYPAVRIITMEDAGEEPVTPIFARRSNDTLVYIIYTSGSTGRPKGVAMPEKALFNLLIWHEQQYGRPNKRVLQFASINFDASFQEIFGVLCFGGSVHLIDEEGRKDMANLLQAIEIQKITQLFIPYVVLKNISEQAVLEQRYPASLELIFTAGEQLRLSGDIREFCGRTGTTLVNYYGPSETHVVSWYEITDKDYQQRPLPPIGRPISNTQLYIVDGNGALCGIGTWGELYIGGEQVAKGYWKNELLTADRFVEDIFNPHQKKGTLYRTGDICRWLADGNIEFGGRADDQVKIRGIRVEPGEVENALQQTEEVSQCVVLASPDSHSSMRLIAYIVPNGAFNKEAILGKLRARLPEYMVPSLLVEIKELPVTGNGKIDRRRLPDVETSLRKHQEYEGPRNTTEQVLCTIWQEVLKKGRISINDNFFELGGHSLLGTRVVSLIRKELQVELPIRDLFLYPSIAQLSAQLQRTSRRLLLPVVKAGARPARIPLSFSQERLWFIDRLQGSVPYHMPMVLRLQGTPDLDALEKAFRDVISRHEILRTVLLDEEGVAYQQVLDCQHWRLDEVTEVESQGSGSLKKWVEALICRPFNLSKDYMLRAHLAKLQNQEYLLVIVLHHIAGDGWSMPVLMQELVAIYTRHAKGREIELPVLPVQYADYAIWQQQYLQGEAYEIMLQYWQHQLAGVEPLQLPTDFPRPAIQSMAGDHLHFRIEPELTELLQALSRQQEVSLFMTLLSVFNILLYRYSGREDISVGSSIANRRQKDIEGLIGFFVNTLVLRNTVAPNQSFTDFLRQVKETTLAAYDHQDVPFEKIVEAIAKDRNMTWNPLFQVSFVMLNNAEAVLEESVMEELAVRHESFEFPTSKFDCTFSVRERNGGLQVVVEYCSDLFTAATIRRMFDHYRQLLLSVVANPSGRANELPMLTAEERRELLVDFNNTGIDYSAGNTVVHLMEEQARRFADKLAILQGDRSLTYRELDERSTQLARHLQMIGVKAETLVPVCLPRGIDMLVAIWGILKAGGAYVPLDPAYPQERMDWILQDTGSWIVITDNVLRSSCQWADKIQIVDITTAAIDQLSGAGLGPVAEPGHLAYVIYTSGSTGNPKGVMIEHRSLLNYVLNARSDYMSDQPGNNGSFLHLSYTFDASVTAMFVPLVTGRSIVIGREQGTAVFNDTEFYKNLPYDFIKLTPAHLPLLNALPVANNLTRKLVVGGEALLLKHIRPLMEDGMQVEIINEYGPTEATVGCITYTVNKAALDQLAREDVLIGKPTGNVFIYITDKERQLQPVGVPGEICIGGIQVARGYVNRPELTAEKFVANPFRPGEVMYCTGDKARWLPGGNIEFIGRMDDQVKIRGYRVEPGEVEAILDSLDLVHSSCVVARPDQDGWQSLTGYYVPELNRVKDKAKELYEGQVASWKALYENTYQDPEETVLPDPEFDITGWYDSFTGGMIPAVQMREWRDDIIQVILAGKPRRVLEIGCGTGLIYYGLCDHIEQYIGADFSQASVQKISTHIKAASKKYPPTSLQVAAAHEVKLEADQKVDTVILNSIVQYFPGEDYLTQVLLQSMAALKGGGRVIIGDVRDYRLLKWLKTRLVLPRVSEQYSLRDLEWQVEQEVAREEELCLSPGYFYQLQSLYPEISRVEIVYKQAEYSNELSLYRYTVILYVGVNKQVLQPDWQPWKEVIGPSLLQQLEAGLPLIGCRDLPNPRLWQERLLAKGMQEKSKVNVGTLVRQATVKDSEQLLIEEILQQAKKYGYTLRFLVAPDEFKTHLLLERQPADAWIQLPQTDNILKENGHQVTAYANIPLWQDSCALLNKEIRASLQQNVPDYLIPGRLLALSSLPLTVHGKVDRKLLASTEVSQSGTDKQYERPRTRTEESLTGIWQQLLRMDKIGIHDNFFELGGHSLLATRVVAIIRKELSVELAIRDLFVYPTIARLAEQLDNSSTTPLLPAIIAVERPARIPLTFSQERLWFIDRLQGSIHYHVPLVLRLTGRLDTAVLEQSFRELVNRHEVLRTVIKEEEGIPYQYVQPLDNWTMGYEQLGSSDELTLRIKIEQIVGRPFDLSEESLLRVQLFQQEQDQYTLVVVQHHIASDGWSMPVLVRELSWLYNAGLRGVAGQLPALPVQYADYALWQRRYLSGAVLEQQLAYWQEQLAGLGVLELPTDKMRPAVQSTRGRVQHFVIGEGLHKRLAALSQQQGVTLYMTLLSALKILLHRYSGQRDIAVGSPIANRRQQETEGLIGFFVNTLVLRSQVDPGASYTELLRQVKATTLSAYEHQDTPFEKLVELLSAERDMSRSPLFQVLFVLQNNEAAIVEEGLLGDLTFQTMPVVHQTSKFDLTFSLQEQQSGLALGVEYCTDLYEDSTIERLYRHYHQLLESIVAGPGSRIADLQMLPLAEEEQLLKTFNDTAVEYGGVQSIPGLLAGQAIRTPDAVAVVYGQERLSYRALDERGNQVARCLQRSGVVPGSPVGVCLERSLELVIAIVGILKSGGAYVPIDPAYPLERIHYMLTDTGVSVVVSGEGCRDLISHPRVNIVTVSASCQESLEPVEVPYDASQPGYIIYTSGSTGHPKGVSMPCGSLVNLLLWHEQQYGRSHKQVLQFASINFDASFQELFSVLCFGGTVHLVGEEDRKDMGRLLEIIQSGAISDLFIPYIVLKNLGEQASRLDRYPGSLELIFTAGEQLRLSDDIHQLCRRTGCRLVNYYGPSETHVVSSYEVLESDYEDHVLPPIGRPVSNTQLYILDGEGSLCGIGIWGELYIGGVQVAAGYWGKEELTAARFVEDVYSERAGAKLYRSGDICRWRGDGNLEFLGRRDHQVKIRGYRVELGEVEQALQQASGVKQCVVVAQADPHGSNRLIAYVVGDIDKLVVLGELKSRLPEYMVPSLLVELDGLPVTSNGKVDRGRLPGVGTLAHRPAYEGARTATEGVLVRIWEEVLKLEGISIHDNFFELGGHSLLATRVVSAIRKELQTELAIRDLFLHPSIAGLSVRLVGQDRGLLLPGLGSVERPALLPVSFSQERLWFIDRLQGSVQYHLPMVLRLEGHLDQRALEKACQTVINRHEVLRTVIRQQTDQPYQHILSGDNWQLLLEEKSLSLQDRAECINRLIYQPFDLSKDYLLRAHLLDLDDGDHVLVLVLHHIAADGWSMPLLVRELVQLYNAYASGQVLQLPVLPVQYADYAIWQRNYLQGSLYEAKLDYWKHQLNGLEPLQLPADKARPQVQSVTGAQLHWFIEKALTDQLEALSRQQQTTLFMTLLSVFKVLLYRYSGQEDIAVGSPVAGRTQRETEGLIGLFVNTLVLRSTIDPGKPFTTFLQSVKETTLSAYEHQDMPFEKIVEAVVQDRSLSYSPLFQVMFALQNNEELEVGKDSLQGLQLSREPFAQTTSRFDLTVSVRAGENGLVMGIEYCTDLYEASTIERMFGHYRQLLYSVVADPEARIGALPMLSEAEQKQLLETFNDTAADYPEHLAIAELVARQVERTPNAVAVTGAGQQLTYRTLDEQSDKLARYLRSKGVDREVLVPVCMERGVDLVVVMLGIMKAGGAYAPVDPAHPEARIGQVLKDIGSPLVITNNTWAAKVKGAIENIQLITVDGDGQNLISAGEERALSIDTHGHDLVYVIYTSGSTGVPKGAMIEHGALTNFILWHIKAYEVTSESRGISVAGMGFDAFSWEVWPYLAAGGSVHIAGEEDRLSAAALQTFVQDKKITHAFFTSVLATEFMELTRGSQSPLQYLLAGGDRLNNADTNGLSYRVINNYGPTENTIVSTYYPIAAGTVCTLPPIGKPVNNYTVHIVDKYNQLAPIGVPGELCLGGVGVGRGYLNRPELTAQKFVANPFRPGERMYRTGDQARWLPDGNVEFISRIDDQVKIRGFRIEPGEIDVVLQQSGFVKQSATLALPDHNGNKRLVTYVAAEGDADKETIIRYLQSQLPEYMVPALLIILPVLPLNSNGKLDRRLLTGMEMLTQDSPAYVAPRTAREQIVGNIWENVLKVNQVGIHDNFFELGGHSLLATKVVSAIRRELAAELAIRDLFLYPTIEKLSLHLATVRATPLLPMVASMDRPAQIPLSFSQERLWFIDRLQGSIQYHVPLVVQLTGKPDIVMLEQSFRTVVQRHEVLRTVFKENGGYPYQYIIEEQNWQLDYIEARDCQADQAALLAKITHLIDRPFDLSVDYMLRAHLLQVEEEIFILIIVLHHIASDGWSMPVLVRELSWLYNAGLRGVAGQLPALPVQYADYALWQRRYLSGAVLEQQLAYWQEQLAGLGVLELPTDKMRPAVQSTRGRVQHFVIEEGLHKRLAALSQQQGVTLYMTLLSALKILLHRYSGQRDIAVGSPIANRRQQETEGLIGFFVNTLVLRSQVDPGASYTELLRQVKATTLSAYEHQDTPFEKVVDQLVRNRDTSRSPLFQVLFVLQNNEAMSIEEDNLNGLSLRSRSFEHTTAKFDLTFFLQEINDRLLLQMEYCTDLYEDSTIERLYRHYHQLLESIVAGPGSRIADLQMLPLAEEEQLLKTFNDTAVEYGGVQSIPGLLAGQAIRTPDAVAVVYGQERLSYRALDERGNQVARCLQRSGVVPGSPVGVCLERSLELVIAIVGILKSGGAYVPIDPAYPLERIHYMLTDTGVSVVVSGEGCRDLISHPRVNIVTVSASCQESLEPVEVPYDASQPGYIIYTSGSTGHPKGVSMPCGSLVNLLLWHEQQYGRSHKQVLQFASINFDASFQELFSVLCFGGTVHLVGEEDRKDMGRLLEIIQSGAISDLFIPYIVLKNLGEQASRLDRYPGSLELIFTAGEQLRLSDDIHQLCRRTGCRLVNYYGPSETHVVSSYEVLESDYEDHVLPPIGRPVSNTQLYILDGEGSLCGIGIWGELYIGGVQVAAGYWGKEELTAARFVEDVYSERAGAKLYRSGDICRWREDGNLEFLGRRDHQVKIRGYRVELGEVEQALQQASGVKQCVVVAQADPHGSNRLIAYVVGDIDKLVVLGELKSRLPEYMVPSLLVELDGLPVTSNGKVDRGRLPGVGTLAHRPAYEGARTATEGVLVRIWEEVLKLEGISIHDNFFELGGHSINANAAIFKANIAFGIQLPMILLFKYPVLEDFAKHMDEIIAINAIPQQNGPDVEEFIL